jgi:hypothetical protein
MDLPKDLNRFLISAFGVRVIILLDRHVAQASQCVSLADPVSEFPIKDQSFTVLLLRLLIMALGAYHISDTLQRIGFAPPIPDLAID